MKKAVLKQSLERNLHWLIPFFITYKAQADEVS